MQRTQPDLTFLFSLLSYDAIQLQLDVNKSLLNLHKIAEENNDPQLCDFIESEYLEEQVEAIKKIADLVTQLNRVGGDGLGCKSLSLSLRPLAINTVRFIYSFTRRTHPNCLFISLLYIH
jgi:hypothetical protein